MPPPMTYAEHERFFKALHSESLPELKLIFAGNQFDINSIMGCSALLHPLVYAISIQSPMNIIHYFISLGADVNWVHQLTGSTVLHFAVKANRLDVIELLVDNGADMYAKNKEGKTPLELAQDMQVFNIEKELKSLMKRSQFTRTINKTNSKTKPETKPAVPDLTFAEQEELGDQLLECLKKQNRKDGSR